MTTLMLLGAVCVIAAIVGGGLTVSGITIPFMSLHRQAALGVVGLVLFVLGATVDNLGANPSAPNAESGGPGPASGASTEPSGGEGDGSPPLEEPTSSGSASQEFDIPQLRTQGTSTAVDGGDAIDVDSTGTTWRSSGRNPETDLIVTGYNDPPVKGSDASPAQFVKLPPTSSPIYETCESQSGYQSQISDSDLETGAQFCAITSDDRFSFVEFQSVERDPGDNRVTGVTVDFHTWE